MNKILVIDNYDSFTYNLVQYLKDLSCVEIVVKRNDLITLDFVRDFDKILISPGPGIRLRLLQVRLGRDLGSHKSKLALATYNQHHRIPEWRLPLRPSLPSTLPSSAAEPPSSSPSPRARARARAR